MLRWGNEIWQANGIHLLIVWRHCQFLHLTHTDNDVNTQLWRQIDVFIPKPLHGDVTSLAQSFFEFFWKTIDLHEKCNCGPSFRSICSVSEICIVTVMTELFAKTACQKLFRVKRSKWTTASNLKSDPILLIYIASRRRRTRKYPPRI